MRAFGSPAAPLSRCRCPALRYSHRQPAPMGSSSWTTTAKGSLPDRMWMCGSMGEQEQFLQVLDRDEAERRFRAAIDVSPRGIERVPLDSALGRVLAVDVTSPVDVPSFDRSNVDGFAVMAADTFGAA